MIKDKLIEKIKRDDHVSFVEIERLFEKECFDFTGTRSIRLEDYINLVVWAGWNSEAIELINDIIANEAICAEATTPLTYIIDGSIPNMPVAKKIKNYKKERWVPMVLRTQIRC